MGLIRVALAMAVLFGHLPIISVPFMNAGLAVQAFFIVSGYYMSLVLSGKYRDVGLFYSNRFLRLAPSYLAVMALSAIAVFGFNASATASADTFALAFSNPMTALVMAFENLAVLGQEMLFWFTIGDQGQLVFDASGALPAPPDVTVAWQALLVPQSWSLSMEFMFYLIAPFLARLGWRTLAAIAAASMALRLAGHALPVEYGIWQGRLFPTVLFLFVFGMLAHRAAPFAAKLPKAVGFVTAAILLALIIGLPHLHIQPELSRWIMYVLIALGIPFVFNATKNIAIDRWIGDLSYPLYLTHLLVIGAVLTFNPPTPAWIAIGGSLALSVLILVLIEHPVDRWRQRRVEKVAHRVAAAPATA
ncbi:MAG: acyltransferase [Hyphomonadaceae bacterium]